VTAAAASMPRHEAAALLGVREDASATEVQHAYLRAARRTHPDVLPDADDESRLAAAEAFDRLTRARDVLVATLPVDPLDRAAWAVRPDAPPARRTSRGLAGSLVVLALLGFLLVGIVAVETALVGDPTQVPGVSSTP
jgi:curved DNA-binding protein CbpA